MSDGRFDRAIAAIDVANAGDPGRLVVDGVVRPKEQAHAELMTEWVRRLDPDASEAQLLAARAHHLRRWVVARKEYPSGRGGYLRWRADQKRRHAEEVGTILAEAGYGAEVVERVQRIVAKVGLGKDPDVQTHEDALCLVFLSTQFDELDQKLGDDKMVEVIAKTWRKMSERGHHLALTLPLPPEARSLIERAVAAG
ncbi:MAG: DUF4202 domain-containing protein [Acidimicrobiales bacterium]